MEINLDTTEKVVSVIAGLIAILGALGAVAWKRRSRSNGPQQPDAPIVSATTGNQTVSVNVNSTPAQPLSIAAVGDQGKPNIGDLKRSANILFIDDDRGFKIVGVLKKMGWENTKLVTDITSLEQAQLQNASVVFIDVQGVGRAMQFVDEGLGLALAIRRRYPSKKLIIYSAEEKGQRFHEALQEVDYSLAKTAEPVRFEEVIVRVLSR